MTACFEVARNGKAWVVRSDTAVVGHFRTQMDAFNAAVAAARQLRKEGRRAQVRVLHDARERAPASLH